MTDTKFKFRAFTALIMFWSFVLETISGIVLYIVPPGRIANWTNWKLWGLTKHEWGALHTIFGYVFLIFAVWHVTYNWKPILNYIRRKVKSGLKARKEMIVSVALTLLFTIATLAGIPPFSTIMDVGESLKSSWEESRQEPFMAHAELLTFKEFVSQINVPLDKAVQVLSTQGITMTDPEIIIQELAKEHNMSPSQIHQLILDGLAPEEKEIAKKVQSKSGAGAGGGYGWKTIRDLSGDLEMPVQDILDFLKAKGITASPDDVIRDIAEENGLKAYDLVRELRESKD